MNKLKKVITILVLSLLSIFTVTFTVYFFNLDMKLTSAIEPLLNRHYDKLERDTHL